MERKQGESSLDMADLVVVKNTKKLVKINHFGSIFMHADSIDMLLMSLGCIGAFGDGLSSPMMMLILSKVMNSLAGGLGSDLGYNISKNAFNFLYLALWSLCVAFLEGYCWTRTGERQASRMRYKYLKAVLRQDVGYFDLSVTSTSEVITSVSNDTLVIQDAIGEKMPNLLMNMFKFLASYIIGFVLSWRLAIVGLPFALLLIIPGLTYGWILIGVTRKIRGEYNKAGAVVEQAISSIRTVYSFVGEDKTKNKFSHALQGSVKLGLKQGLVKGVAIGSATVTFAIWAFMSWYGSELIIHDKAKGGSVYAVGALNAIGGISLGAALSNLAPLSEACSAGERILEVIKRVPKIDSENMEGEILPSVSGEVEFKSIKFAYPSRPDSIVLQDFNLKVPAGKTIALVGGSGSGKSTVIALLERFYNPVSGEILLDGIPIDKFQLKWLRSQMGLVSQEPALFATSIRENILFGKDDATFEEVIAAAKASNAHNFISQLSQGYDTQVGERGIQMSGGQKQRIAIARAIVKTPRVLLLDEATSALDSESEKVVQEALDNAAVGRTTLVIAHRLSTIRNVDVIVVVQNGHVMEIGSHEKLIQHKNGMYSSFVRLQQIEQKIEENTSTLLTSSSHIRNGDTNHSSQRLSLVNQSGTVNLSQGTRVSSVDENTTKSTPPPSFRRLLLLNIPEWKHGILGCTSAMLSGAMQPIHSFMLGGMITVYFLSDHNEIRAKNRIYSLTAFGLAVFSLIVNICQHYNFAAMGEYLTKRIRERMLSKIMTFEVGWYDQEENSSGAVCSRLDRDANTVRSLVGDRMALLLQTLSAVTVACTMGIVIAWRFAIVMIASQPLIIMCFYFRKVLLQKLSRKAIVSQDESSKLAAEAVSNLRTVTAYSSQSRILEMLDRAQDEPRRENIRQAWYAGIVLGVASSLSACSWALDFWYGGRLISQGRITAKELFQTHMVLINTGRVIADAGSMTTDLAKSVNTVGSVFSVLDRHTQIDSDDPVGFKPEQLSGCIELHDVHFAYPARNDTMIFKGFSLNIEAGQSTALVGQSGSGKSTIISLIERFYDPLMGTVKIDGRDVKSYNLKSLRKHIAIVSQEPTLFSGTIKENILYGASYMVDEAEIINAAKAANAHGFIAGLKDGYNTCCGNKGLQLSGGQKQRIAIARAILVNPRILLLDEATSALDSKSEKAVQDALDLLMVGRTSVVVAHRLSTIRNCHTIVVLDKGVVVEKGNHSSLFAKGPSGAYYGLVSIQQQQKPNTHQPLG